MQIPQIMKTGDGQYISAELIDRKDFGLSTKPEQIIVPSPKSLRFCQLNSAGLVTSHPIIYRQNSSPGEIYTKLRHMLHEAGSHNENRVYYAAFAIELQKFSARPIRADVAGFNLPAEEDLEVLVGTINYYRSPI
jgi:hypothetical protein